MDKELQRLRSILDSLQAGTWEWHIPSDTVIANARWAQIVGYTLQELEPVTGRTSVALYHPEDLVHSSQRMAAYFAGQQPRFDSEVRLRHKQGHWVWVRDSGCIVERDSAGRPVKMVGVRQDITERKQAEELARSEGERFLALARVSNTGVWEWSQTQRLLWASPEYFTMLGRDPGDYAGQSSLAQVWSQWLHPDDLERATQAFADYLAGGAIGMYESEFRMQHANGSWIWIWSRGSGLSDARGLPQGRVVGTHINITSLKQARAHLRESQQQLELISNNIPDAMVFQLDCGLAGEQRRMTYVSQGVLRTHGLTAEAVQQDVTLLYRQLLPEDAVHLQEVERACIADFSHFKVEARSRLPDGSLRWFMVFSSPRRLDNGHIVFDGIEMDITERKQHEQEIFALNTRLEQRVQERTAELQATLQRLEQAQEGLLQSEKLASLGALVAGVAHELNTPIGNAVTLASTLLQAHRRLQQQVAGGLTRGALNEYLADVLEGGEIIERNLQRAAELLGSFKQLAVDQTSTQRRSFDLQGLVQEIALTMRPAIRKTRHQLHCAIAPGVVMDSYPGPLGQVLMNLIGNALIHAFASDAQGSIWLQGEQAEAGWVRLRVSDDGCGIPAQHHKRVFDPFFTTKLGQGGSGLGLHIVYTLVTGLLGGRIALESARGTGSSFLLELPLCAPAGAREAGAAAPGQAGRGSREAPA